MNETQTFLIDYLLGELVKLIMLYQKITLQDAFDILYNSRLYDKIMDVGTGLYFQSADYNYELLMEERNNEKS